MGLTEVMSARVRSLNLPPSHLKVSKSGKENTGSYAGVTIKEVIGDPVDAKLNDKTLNGLHIANYAMDYPKQ